MKNEVNVYFDIPAVAVDLDYIRMSNVSLDLIKDKLPQEIVSTGVLCLGWSDKMNLPLKGYITLIDGSNKTFGEDKYNDYVQPYVDLWQAEKDRQEQEQAEAEAEYAKFENRKERALQAIQTDYENALSKGFVRSSMKFDADISIESSATLSGTNISLAYMATLSESPQVTVFRDFYGLKRELDQTKVATLICEINQAQNHIREQKYKFKDMVKDTFNNDELNEVVTKCIYTTLDFTGEEVTEIPFTQSRTIQDRIDEYHR